MSKTVLKYYIEASNVSSFSDLFTDKQCQCSSYYNDLLAKGTIFYAQFKTEYFSRSKKVWKRLLQKFPNRKLSSKNLLTNQLCSFTFFFKIVFSPFFFFQKALANALRYFPSEVHKVLAAEFAKELEEYGHIYMYRFLPPFHLR